jgi:hypothetical protein
MPSNQQTNGGARMLRGEPYTFEEFMAARAHVLARHSENDLDELFGDDVTAIGVEMYGDSRGDFGRMGAWTTGLMLGIVMAEARHAE